MIDPIQKLAERQVILNSVQIEAELRDTDGTGPTLGVWLRLRRNAIESLAQLATLNVYDPKDRILIVTHQNEVKRYGEFVNALRADFAEGVALEQQITIEDRRDLIQLIKGMPEEERAMIDTGEENADDMPMD